MTRASKNGASGLKQSKAVAGPTVGAGYARGLLHFAVSKGADRESLLRRSQISAADLDDLDNRIPLDSYVALMNAGVVLVRSGGQLVFWLGLLVLAGMYLTSVGLGTICYRLALNKL